MAAGCICAGATGAGDRIRLQQQFFTSRRRRADNDRVSTGPIEGGGYVEGRNVAIQLQFGSEFTE